MAEAPTDPERRRQEEEAVEAIIVELRALLWERVARGGSIADVGPVENLAGIFER